MANAVFDPGLGRPHHSGYVVENIEATVERLVEQFGAGRSCSSRTFRSRI